MTITDITSGTVLVNLVCYLACCVSLQEPHAEPSTSANSLNLDQETQQQSQHPLAWTLSARAWATDDQQGQQASQDAARKGAWARKAASKLGGGSLQAEQARKRAVLLFQPDEINVEAAQDVEVVQPAPVAAQVCSKSNLPSCLSTASCTA